MAAIANDRPFKLLKDFKIFRITIFLFVDNLHLLNFLLLLLIKVLKVYRSLLKRSPNRYTFGYWPEFGSFKFIQKMIVFIKKVLLLVQIRSDSKLNFPNQSSIISSINQSESSSGRKVELSLRL